MRLKHVLLVCLAIAFVISQVGIVPASASGNLYKISVVDGNVTLGELSTYGVSIEETYDNFVIGSIDLSQVQTLRDNGFDALEFEPNRNVYINGYTLTADENMILTPTPTTPLDLTFYEVDLNKSNFFILQFGYPVKQEWQDTITQSGAKIVGALSDGALIIKALPQVISSFKQMDRVTGGNVFHPAFKISNDITPDEDGNTKVTVMLHPGERISYIINFIPGESFDGSIDLEDGSFNLECGFEDINQIAWITSVSNISPYIEPELDMDRSREIMGIEARSEDSSPSLDPLPQGIWDMGLRGQGKVVAVQDSGCDTGNLATLNEDYGLPPRIKAHFGYSRYGAGPYFPPGPDPDQSKPWDDWHGHGTFTSGQIVGDGYNSNGQYAGVCPESQLIVQTGLGWLNPGLPDAYYYGARVHSNSWGSNTDTYTASCQYLDQFVWDYPDMVVAVSAGNSGSWGSYSLGTPSVAKNNICVGAGGNNRPSAELVQTGNPGDVILYLDDNSGFSSSTANTRRVCVTGNVPGEDEFGFCMQVLGGNRIRFYPPLQYTHDIGNRVHFIHAETMARFSSKGPTSDERINPDLVAPGRNVMGIDYWRNNPQDDYVQNSGTSMSCPNLAGAAVLTQQWMNQYEQRFEPSAALVKALMINGAREIREDWDGSVNYTPSYECGWGYVDLYNTLFPTQPTRRKYWDWKYGIETGGRFDFPIKAGPGRFKVSLVWTDYPSVPGASKHLVNDLDLIVRSPSGGVIYRGNQFIGGIGNSSESEPWPADRDSVNNVEGVTIGNATNQGIYTISVEGADVPQGPQPFALAVEYQATLPDFDVRVKPDIDYIDSDWTQGLYNVELNCIEGFTGPITLSCSVIGPEFSDSFTINPIIMNGQDVSTTLILNRKAPLTLGKYYIVIRGTSGNIYHEDLLTLVVRPSENYRFYFNKDVGVGGLGTSGDNGVTIANGEKLGYSLNYSVAERNYFDEVYIEDAIPRGAHYNNVAFPLPTHYSTDNGETWINAAPPTSAGYGYRLRWNIHEIPGSGHWMRLSTGVPGLDNVSQNVGSSTQEIMELDSNGYPHVVWSDDTTGDPFSSEIFYRRWNGTEWVDLFGNPGFSDISATVGTYSIEPDMVIDGNNNPHFVWREQSSTGSSEYIYYTRWNGTALVRGDGTVGVDVLSPTINNADYSIPRIATNPSGNLCIGYVMEIPGWWFFPSEYAIYLTNWNGTAWTQLDNTTPGSQQFFYTTSLSYPDFALAIDNAGMPLLAFEQTRYFLWFYMQDDLFTTKWNGSNWVYFNGTTPGQENMVPSPYVRSHTDPELIMHKNVPHLVWSDNWLGNNDIFYTVYRNNRWETANGLTGYDKLTNSTELDSNPVVAIQPNDSPAVSWQLTEDAGNNIMFRWFVNGWQNLFETGAVEKITDSPTESITPQLQIGSNGVPFFGFIDNMTQNNEVYVTYPILGYANAKFPGQIIWEAKVDDAIPAGVSAIINNAYISAKVDKLEYQVTTNKQLAQTINPLDTEIYVKKVASPTTVKLNQNITYTITVENRGSVELTQVNVSDVMPKGMELVSSRPAASKSANGAYWVVNLLKPGESVKLTLVAKITDERLNGQIVTNKLIVKSASSDVVKEDYAVVTVQNATSGYPSPDVTLKPLGELITSNAEFELHVWSGNGPFSYRIDWGDGEESIGNIDLGKPVKLSHDFASSGKYKVECTVTDRFGVTKLIELNVTVK